MTPRRDIRGGFSPAGLLPVASGLFHPRPPMAPVLPQKNLSAVIRFYYAWIPTPVPSSSCSSKPCLPRHLLREIRTRNQPTSPVGPLYIRHLLLIPHTGHSGGRHRQLRSAGTLRFKHSPIALIALARRSGHTSLTWVFARLFCNIINAS